MKAVNNMQGSNILESLTHAKYPARHVYVLECRGAYKIGIACGVKLRLQTLQIGNPFKINFVYARRMNFATSIEPAIHYVFQNTRIRGEWFALDEDQLQQVIDMIEGMDDELIRAKIEEIAQTNG